MATNNNTKKPFRRHFRIYFKNGHPAYIVDEEGNMYVFHRVTHSKTSGGRKNWKKHPNPIKGYFGDMYIVKQEQKDYKTKFSLFEIDIKPGMDVSYPDIKKAGDLQTNSRTRYESSVAGGSQTNHDNVKVVNNITTSTNIKTKKNISGNRKHKNKRKNK